MGYRFDGLKQYMEYFGEYLGDVNKMKDKKICKYFQFVLKS